MAGDKDLGTQAELENSINAAIAGRADLLRRQTAELSAQLQLQREMCDAIKCGADDMANMAGQGGDITSMLGEAADGAEKNSGTQSKLSKNTAASGAAARQAAKGFNVLGGAAAGAMLGAVNAAKKAATRVTSLGSALMTVASTAKKLVVGALSAVSNTIGWLADKANSGAGDANTLTNAFEALKDVTGGLGPEHEAAHGAIDNMRSGMATAQMDGINLASIYGRGPGGLAAAIADVGAMMSEAGPRVQYMTDALQNNTDALLMSRKALGLTGDAMASLGLTASYSGENLGDTMNQINVQVAYMSKRFGVNVRRMGKNIGEMTKDFATFGSYTPKQLAATAAYADRLGVSIKSLQSLTGKTDDFEGAAMAAAELAGSFGMSVDAMELMTAEPAEKAEMVRKAFAESGKDFSEMSRQEKARMAEITGMGAE